jgi:hypothetical protein
MQDITGKAVRPSDSEEHVKFRSIQEDEYRIFLKTRILPKRLVKNAA